MARGERLTADQIAILRRMASGERILYARSGAACWFVGNRGRVDLDYDRHVCGLRIDRLIAISADDPLADTITEAGRRALEEADHG